MVVARAFWLVMLLGHAPALVSVSQKLAAAPADLSLWFKFAFLLGSTVFFCFKLAGYRFTHIHPTPRVLLTFGLIIVLLHTGVILSPSESMHFAGWATLIDPILLASLGVGLAAAILSILRRAARSLVLDLNSPIQPFEFATIQIPARVAVLSAITHRGPPSRTSIQG